MREVGESTDEAMLYTLASDRSGYVREAALRRALELDAGNLLSILAICVNDHVRIIGRAAQRAMLEQVALAPIPNLFDILPAMLALRVVRRVDHSAWLAQFESALCDRVPIEQIRDAVIHAAPRAARACMDMLMRHSGVDVPLIERIFRSTDDIVVLRQALTQVAAMAPAQSAALYRLAARCKLGPIRTVAIRRLLADAPGADIDALAIVALDDSQAGAREAAAAYLQGRQFDVIAHYRAILDDPAALVKPVTTALLALESLRAKSELPSIRNPLFPSPAVRRVALKVWIKLAPDEKDEVALAALHDPAPSVRRFAFTAVSRYGAYLSTDLVFNTLRRDVDQEAYRSFARLDRWTWLIDLALMAMKAEQGGREWSNLRRELEQWQHGSYQYQRPSVEQRRTLAAPAVRSALTGLAAGRTNMEALLEYELTKLEQMPD